VKQLLKVIYVISFLFSYPFERLFIRLDPKGGNDLVKKHYKDGITYKSWYAFMQEHREKHPLNFIILLYGPTVTTTLIITSIIGFITR